MRTGPGRGLTKRRVTDGLKGLGQLDRAAAAGAPGLARRRAVSSARSAMRSSGLRVSGRWRRNQRIRLGTDSTLCRVGTRGRISSTSRAAVSAMLRPSQPGHRPRVR